MDDEENVNTGAKRRVGIGKGLRLAIWEKFVAGDKIPRTPFLYATCKACLAKSESPRTVRGEKSLMEAHYLSCKFVSTHEQEVYRTANKKPIDIAAGVDSLPVVEPTQKKLKQSSAALFFDQPLNSRDKAEFEKKLIDMFVSCNIPFAAVEDPRFMEFVKLLRPAIKLPTRTVLSTRILGAEIAREKKAVAASLLKQANLTLTLDGYKNVRHDNVLGIMLVSKCNGSVNNVLLSTENISTQSHKAEDVVAVIESSIKAVEDLHEARVPYVTCDSEGAHIKARRLMQEKHPSMIFLPCNAHQVNLMVKDTVKSVPAFVSTTKSAMVITTAIAKSAYLQGVLREDQRRLYGGTTAISKPTETRWYSFYNTFVAILESRVALQATLLRAANSPAAFRTAVGSDLFWTNLSRLVDLLKPLVKAQARAESDDCTLADVGTMMADVYTTFAGMQARLSSALLLKLEKRWERFYDVPLMVVAMFLDPKIRMSKFRVDPPKIYLGLVGKWASALYARFFGEKPTRMMDSVSDYGERSGVFRDDDLEQVSTPVRFWNLVKQQYPELARLALHLFLIATHAAAIERGWSQLAYVHSKGRNRLGLPVATGLAAIRMRFQKCDRERGIGKRVDPCPQVISLEDGNGGLGETDEDVVVNDNAAVLEQDFEEDLELFLREQSEVEVMEYEELTRSLVDFFTLEEMFGSTR